MSFTAELDGDDLIAALTRAANEIPTALEQAMSLAVDLAAAQAKQVHDYQDRSGALTQSISGEVLKLSKGKVVGVVTAGQKYAAAIEFGAEPHVIEPKHRKFLRWPGAGGFIYARAVNHPGNKPYRFLQNAVEAVMPDIEQAFEDAVDLAFERAGLS